MDPRALIIWYKDGSTRMVNEHDLKPKHMDKRQVQLVLCPDLYRPNIFIPIKPNPLWLAHEFIGQIAIQCSLLDYEEQLADPLAELPSVIQTNSLVEFVYYITSLYRANGFSDLLSSAISDSFTINYSFYPIKYSFTFKDIKGEIIRTIDNKKLSALKSSTYLDNGLVEFVCKDRLKALKELLYEVECGDSYRETISKLPKAILLSDDMAYSVKKPSRLDMTAIVLYRLYGYESYLVMTPKMVSNILMKLPARCNIGVYDPDICEKSYLVHASQREIKETFAEIPYNPDSSLDDFVLFMELSFSDHSEYLGFMMYLQEFFEYLKIITAVIVDKDCSTSTPQAIMHLVSISKEHTSHVFLDKEISDGKLYSNLMHYLTT